MLTHMVFYYIFFWVCVGACAIGLMVLRYRMDFIGVSGINGFGASVSVYA